MSRITWEDQALQIITAVYLQGCAAGSAKSEIIKAIDDACPYGERAGYGYRCWMQARRSFLIEHHLSNEPGARLRNRNASVPQGQAKLPLSTPHNRHSSSSRSSL